MTVWVDQRESFSCALDHCTFELGIATLNSTLTEIQPMTLIAHLTIAKTSSVSVSRVACCAEKMDRSVAQPRYPSHYRYQ